MRKLTNQEFIKRSRHKHGDKYDYSLVNYVDSRTKVKIICRLESHGVFEQRSKDHYSGQGCPKCGKIIKQAKRTNSVFQFINSSVKNHGDKYDYSLVEYKNNKTKVKIICHDHGMFRQTPNEHIGGRGCPKCGRNRTTLCAKENPTGWNVTNWEISAQQSKRFDSFKVYIIRCWSDNESFYKIGRTFLKIKNRFIPSKIPYNYEVIKEIIFDTAKGAFDKEAELKRLHKTYKYVPKIPFGGKHECFYKINFDILN